MKKLLIASLVGGILLFLWQFISWNMANFHESVQQYTPQQEKIISFLNELNLEEGGYILPIPPPGASMDEWNKLMDDAVGKPWAKVEYHKSLSNNMTMNMVRGLVINILTIFLLCWILMRFRSLRFSNIFTASLLTGLIVFFNVPYTQAIWYEAFDTWAHLADAVISWGLVGAWLGWYLGSKPGREAGIANRRTAVINVA